MISQTAALVADLREMDIEALQPKIDHAIKRFDAGKFGTPLVGVRNGCIDWVAGAHLVEAAHARELITSPVQTVESMAHDLLLLVGADGDQPAVAWKRSEVSTSQLAAYRPFTDWHHNKLTGRYRLPSGVAGCQKVRLVTSLQSTQALRSCV